MKTYKQLTEELDELDEDFGVISGPLGILAGLLISDALGIFGAPIYPEKSFLKAMKAGRFGFTKAVIAKVQDVVKMATFKKTIKQLASDPEVREMMDTMMHGRAFKPGMKDKGMEILKRKGKDIPQLRMALDQLVKAKTAREREEREAGKK